MYILNSLIIPVDFSEKLEYTVSVRKIDLQEARKIVSSTDFISAVGHEPTAKVLSELLGVEIPFNRIAIKMKKGDVGLHFALKTRLPEGKVLTKEELQQLEFDLVLSEVK
jgi:hypothetical protein